MKKLFSLSLLTLVLASCDALEGKLQVSEELTVIAKKNGLFQKGTREVKVPVALYDAKLNPTSKKNIDLEIKVDGKTAKIPFAIPQGTVLPETEGRVEIPAATNGQAYDLTADVSTKSGTGQYSQNESCVLRYRMERRCDHIPSRRHCEMVGGGESCTINPAGEKHCAKIPVHERCVTIPSRTECHDVSIPVYGDHNVRYQRSWSTRHVDAELSAAGRVVGVFNHQNTTSHSTAIGSDSCR